MSTIIASRSGGCRYGLKKLATAFVRCPVTLGPAVLDLLSHAHVDTVQDGTLVCILFPSVSRLFECDAWSGVVTCSNTVFASHSSSTGRGTVHEAV